MCIFFLSWLILLLFSLWPHTVGKLWQCGDVQVWPPARQHRRGGSSEETSAQHSRTPQGLWAGNWDPQIPPTWEHCQIQRSLLQCRYEHVTWCLHGQKSSNNGYDYYTVFIVLWPQFYTCTILFISQLKTQSKSKHFMYREKKQKYTHWSLHCL